MIAVSTVWKQADKAIRETKSFCNPSLISNWWKPGFNKGGFWWPCCEIDERDQCSQGKRRHSISKELPHVTDRATTRQNSSGCSDTLASLIRFDTWAPTCPAHMKSYSAALLPLKASSSFRHPGSIISSSSTQVDWLTDIIYCFRTAPDALHLPLNFHLHSARRHLSWMQRTCKWRKGGLKKGVNLITLAQKYLEARD